jgi:hypothetical protein
MTNRLRIPSHEPASLGRTRMYCRDLFGFGGEEENEEPALYVALTAGEVRGQDRGAEALQSPAVREHGQERRYRELPHAVVAVCR